MSQLSKQSIRALCTPPEQISKLGIAAVAAENWTPLIAPFSPDKIREHGVSKGLSHASYDASIDHDLVLGRHPAFIIRDWLLCQDFTTLKGIWRAVTGFYGLAHLQHELRTEPSCYSLAYTVEDFCMPASVSAQVCDKSTYARVFVSAFNTFFDPGFHGNATLELVNHSDKRVHYKKGQAVCQFVFSWLDHPTEAPYDGKYQHQGKQAQEARWYDSITAASIVTDNIKAPSSDQLSK